MPCNSNNFHHSEKIQRAYVNNVDLRFKTDRIRIVRVLLLIELKNEVFRKTKFRVCLPTV